MADPQHEMHRAGDAATSSPEISAPFDTASDAYADATAASWHPAMRPDSVRVHSKKLSVNSDADFFDRYPAPTPEKSRMTTIPVSDDGSVSPSPIAQETNDLVQVARLDDLSPESHQEWAQTVTDEPHGGPAAEEDEEEEQEEPPASTGTEAVTLSHDHAADSQSFQNEDIPDSTQEQETTQPEAEESLPTSLSRSDAPTNHHPEATYEHQGETTELEEAVEVAPSVPLMADAEAAPTVVETQPTVPASMATTETPSEPEIPHLDRAFTTNFTEMPTEDILQESDTPVHPISDGWPAVGDDKTFGELLDHEGESSADPSGGWPAVGDDKTFGESLDNEAGSSAHPSAFPSANDQLDDGWGNAGNDDTFGELLGEEKGGADPGGKTDDDTALWEAAFDDDGLLEDSNDLDPSQFFGDDDGGFLEDDVVPAITAQTPAVQQSTSNAYTPTTAQSLGLGHGRSSGTPQTGLHDVYGQATPAAQRPSLSSAQSFADKAKGGYQSPYDLPMEVVKPRQRQRQAQAGTPAAATPPPRSSSFSSTSAPPMPRSVTANPAVQAAGQSAPVPSKSTPPTDEGFFADLPVTAKPRSRQSYAPQSQSSPSLSMNPGLPPQQRNVSLGAPQQSPAYVGLSQPERLPLLPEQPASFGLSQSQPPPAPAPNQRYSPSSTMRPPAVTQNRFSPAPPTQAPPTNSRYSPAPAASVPIGQQKRQPSLGTIPGIQQAHAFLPRTSSPLAFSSEQPQAQIPSAPSSPPKGAGFRSPGTPDRTVSSRYSPMDPSSQPPAFSAVGSPPSRPRTQSPPTFMKTPKYSSQNIERPKTSTTAPSTRPMVLPARQRFSNDVGFVVPGDERGHDPLQRWKGHPIFKWGASGAIVSSFPVQTPFYSAGQGVPSLKCSPGSISLQDAATVVPISERNAKFPGPLAARAKGRKKDVVSWMSSKIEDLEQLANSASQDFQMDVDLKKRTEEKLVLWKIMKIFVENDGNLEGNPKITDEVRAVLLPNLADMRQTMDLQSPQAVSAPSQTAPADRSVIMELRLALLEGQKERAVWLAEEKRLWGHAMLIASTMGPETWKQIIQSFVRSQVQSVGSDARSLAALYQIFAGNSEECVDELVPSSARAGFQMVSKVDGSVSNNPLEGLDQWRETLGLVAGNRTPNDGPSLLALGKLLASYGRAEAAHTCYLFARQVARHGGADDTEAHFVLLGSNGTGSEQAMLGSDLDSIILTEIYEWASSLSAPANATHYGPHFQAFKLIHAQVLATHGLKAKAQSYCDNLAAALKSTTRLSPYYHPAFTHAVDDLTAFLSKTPQTGSQGYLSKTAMTKISAGAASWITKSLLGDDEGENNDANAGGNDLSGPFGRVNGDSPTISRTVSTTELYNPMAAMSGPYNGLSSTPPQSYQPAAAAGKYAPNSANSRYAPSNGNGVAEAIRAQPARSYAPTASAQGTPRSDGGSTFSELNRPYSSDSKASLPMENTGYGASPYGYQPFGAGQPLAEEPETQDLPARPNGVGVHEPSVDAEDGGYVPPSGGYEPPSGGYEPPSAGYEPPSGGYEPPSYQPYEPEPEPEEETHAPKPKKKSFMDDDEDDDELAGRAAAMKKAQADREADEAFRKAAEADAQRDKAKASDKRGSGWLSGWFKKDGDAPQQGPIRAKLGEENSFVYDETLKKWVNKKAGAEAATPVAATPPPPRGPSARAPGSAGGPPSGPPSRVASAAFNSRPPTAGSAGTPGLGPSSGPPSRVGTPGSGSNGPPLPAAVTALNGSAEGGPTSTPLSRSSTVASDASSLDDLLGGPPGPGRKAAGGAKGKKKGRGYVDVMQK